MKRVLECVVVALASPAIVMTYVVGAFVDRRPARLSPLGYKEWR